MYIEKIEKEIDDNPIKFGNFNIKCKSKTKYLGQIFGTSLLSGSGAWIGNIENAVKLCNQL